MVAKVGAGRVNELRVQLLNGFQICLGERVIPAAEFRLKRARTLLKCLALAAEHRLQRDQLLEILWPDQDPGEAANNLHQVLYQARRVLDPSGAYLQQLLVFQDETIHLCQGLTVWVDVEAFEAAAEQARRGMEPAACQAALDLYTGDLLPEDRYEDWASARREALRETALSLWLEQARRAERLGDYPGAMRSLQQALAVDPLQEDAHLGLMRLYALSGQRAQALHQYQTLRESLRRELEAEPDPQATQLYQDILTARFSAQAATGEPPSRESVGPPYGQGAPPLPIPLNLFIGREKEKAEILWLLGSDAAGQPGKFASSARLLTLTGSAGCGKTRLALEAASNLKGVFRDGVWLVELADLSDSALVPQALADCLHLQDTAVQPLVDRLAGYLQGRQLLLVLDNCEHLVEACARLTESLLRLCPRLQILATSQEPMGIAEEVIYLVPSLALPDNEKSFGFETMKSVDSIRLFVDRANRALPGFTLSSENAKFVAQICQRLDGIPLAIELAAAQVKLMQVAEIAVRLDQRFRLLVGGSRTAPPRQKSLSASIEWSYQLLSEKERLLFRQLAVFIGSWDLEAAEQVVGGAESGIGAIAVVDVASLLAQLVNKSIVVVRREQEETRYAFLETIRQYAAEHLKLSGEEITLHLRHLMYYCRLVEQADKEFRGPRQPFWMKRLEAEHANIREAFEWSLIHSGSAAELADWEPRGNQSLALTYGLRLAAALKWFWHFELRRGEAVDWSVRALEVASRESEARRSSPEWTAARARILHNLAWFEESDRREALLMESLSLYRGLGAAGRPGATYVLLLQAEFAYEGGDYTRVKALAAESEALFREVGDRIGLAELLSDVLGPIAMDVGDFSQAIARQEEGLALNQACGDRSGVAWSLLRLSEIYFFGWGDYLRALDLQQRARAIYQELGDRLGLVLSDYRMAQVCLAQGEETLAAEHLSEMLRLAREVGDQDMAAIALACFGRMAQAQGEAERADQLYAEVLQIGWETKLRILANPLQGRDGALLGRAEALHGRAEAALTRGDTAAARLLYREALALGPDLADSQIRTLRLLEGYAGLAADQGQPERAVRLLAAGDSFHRFFMLTPRERQRHTARIQALQAALSAEGFARLWAEGRALNRDQAIEEALV